MKRYLLDRAHETSTWCGLLLALSAMLGWTWGPLAAGLLWMALPDQWRPRPREVADQFTQVLLALPPEVRDEVFRWIAGRRGRP